jgi:hypothetical protein
MYSYYTSVGGNVPAAWLLECMARHKIPNIIVKSRLDATDEELSAAARAIGEFRMPMFIHPAPVESGFNPGQYTQFFRRAAGAFREHAPDAAIVWTVKAEDVFDCQKFYPGDNYVDWVGISLYQTITGDKIYDPGLQRAFEHFYYSFQKTKPIMLTEYAVSHQSSIDLAYRVSMAADEIARVYGGLPREFPRLKAIVYMDVNTIMTASSRDTRDNFALLEQPEILAAYSAAVATEAYLSRLYPRPAGTQAPQLMRSPFMAYKIGGELFISRATIEQDMNIRGAVSRLESKDINGREYFSSLAFAARRVETDADEKRVVIRR